MTDVFLYQRSFVSSDLVSRGERGYALPWKPLQATDGKKQLLSGAVMLKCHLAAPCGAVDDPIMLHISVRDNSEMETLLTCYTT